MSPGLRRLRTVSLSAAIFSFALVAWGAIVRINGAGMTCPDWPRCRGVWFPAYDPKVIYEISHRYGAAVLTIVVAATFLTALAARREAQSAYRAAWVAIGLIVAQVVAGAVTIVRSNDPPSVAVHLVLGFATFACLTVVTLLAYLAPETDTLPESPRARLQLSRAGFARLALASAVLALFAVFAAGFMSASNDGLACTGFPLCAGFVGAQNIAEQIHMGHRYAAYATIAAVTVTWLAAILTRSGERAIVAVAWTAFVLMLVQGSLGVLAVATRLAPVIRSLHEANGALLVCSLVVLTVLASRADVAGRS